MNKRIVMIVILLSQVLLLPLSARTSTDTIMLRDSVFGDFYALPDTESKFTFLRNRFYRYIGQEWAVELLDSALTLPDTCEEPENLINIYTDYYMHYKYQTDLRKMEYYIAKIKEVSYEHENYKSYFQLWNDILQFYNIRGSSEYVRLEAIKMGEEARRLNYQMGVAYSYLVMARSLNGAKKYDEAIEMYHKVLDNKEINLNTRSMVLSEIATLYQECGKPEKSLEELDTQRIILGQIIGNDAERLKLYSDHVMELMLSYCAAYYELKNERELLNYLTEAEKYYTPNCFVSNYIGYHIYWGGYYCLMQRWEECFDEFDTALAHFGDNQLSLYEKKVRRMKGEALIAAGRYEEAAGLFKKLVLMGDTINKNMLADHEKVNQANYLIRSALLEKEQSEKYFNWLIVGLVLMLVVAMVIAVKRARFVRNQLQRSEEATRSAEQAANDVNKLKEVFLRNIVHEIRIPLNTVVGFSELLATERDLTVEQIEEYTSAIQRDALRLFRLIIDVLDLSRLESGMVKYNVQENDMVQLCRDAEMMVRMQENNEVRIDFNTSTDRLPVMLDSARFLKLLSSVIAAPDDVSGSFHVKLNLALKEKAVTITVTGAPLLNSSESMQNIQHEINRLFLKAFGGSYQIVKEEGKIIIVYPV